MSAFRTPSDLPCSVLAGLQDTILSLRLNDVWGLDSSKIGLVMLAAVIPTIFGEFLSFAPYWSIDPIVSKHPQSSAGSLTAKGPHRSC